MASTPLLGQFLVAINGFIQVRNESQLADYLALEPPFNDHYQGMIAELKQTFPAGSEGDAQGLESRCTSALSAALREGDGSPWTPFIKFLTQYLRYLRDISADPGKYLHTYELLSELQQRANSALTHATLGQLLLPTVISLARLVCRLAIGLDKQPQLIAHLRSTSSTAAAGEDGGSPETLPERAANILRSAFVTCLNDRSGTISSTGRPEGKKRGIYIIANLCLKILFQCGKTRNATQIFENIGNLSPPLQVYPPRDRVTYLYYLGRFLFQNSHFYRAHLALSAAYDQCPTRPDCVRQRRHILIYLLASNIILGRFPTPTLLSRPEAKGLDTHFLPLCHAIRLGDVASFRRHLALDGPHAPWFLHFRLLLQLRNRGEVLVWRSLVRRTWILHGTRPTDDGRRVAPTVHLGDLVAFFSYLDRKAQSDGEDDYTDPDFDGVEHLATSFSGSSIDTLAIESLLSSLIDQGLLNGYISHRLGKFAITGSKAKGGALAAGFPAPWEVLSARAEREDGGNEVPGWKKKAMPAGGAGGFGPGMVVNLSGARPVGTAG